MLGLLNPDICAWGRTLQCELGTLGNGAWLCGVWANGAFMYPRAPQVDILSPPLQDISC